MLTCIARRHVQISSVCTSKLVQHSVGLLEFKNRLDVIIHTSKCMLTLHLVLCSSAEALTSLARHHMMQSLDHGKAELH